MLISERSLMTAPARSPNALCQFGSRRIRTGCDFIRGAPHRQMVGGVNREVKSGERSRKMNCMLAGG